MVSPFYLLWVCAGLCLSVSASETVYFSMCVFLTNDIVSGDQMLHPSLHLGFCLASSGWDLRVCIQPPPLIPLHTEKLQEE